MKTQINLQEFKARYCTTIFESESGNYIKLPVKDYGDLNYLRNCIIDAIHFLGVLESESIKIKDLGITIVELVRILKATNLYDEFEGIELMLKQTLNEKREH